MDLGRPENVELLFRRGQRRGRPTLPPLGGFKTAIDRYCHLVTLNVFYKKSRLKQYLKDGGRAADRDRGQRPERSALQPAPDQPGRVAGQGPCDQRPAPGH